MIKNHTTSISMSTLPQIPDRDGAPGRLMLGARTLDREALAKPQVQDALAAISLSLRSDGAVLLYGCNVAKGEEGRAKGSK
jgi:predicted hotdog family 3-hydroxylacyl-ACP dehydratase